MLNDNFMPWYGQQGESALACLQVTPGVASAAVALPDGGPDVELTNVGTNICYVNFGKTTVGLTASAGTGIPILPSSKVLYRLPQGFNCIAHISASGTTLSIIKGYGQ